MRGGSRERLRTPRLHRKGAEEPDGCLHPLQGARYFEKSGVNSKFPYKTP